MIRGFETQKPTAINEGINVENTNEITVSPQINANGKQ
jgi:hypothetical protein